jgi:hypothetical protein
MIFFDSLFGLFSGRTASAHELLSSSRTIINYIKNKNDIFEELEFEEKLNIVAILFSQSRLDDNIDDIKYIISEKSETLSNKKYSSFDIELHGDPKEYGNIYNRNEVLIDHLFLECLLNSGHFHPDAKKHLFIGILKIPEDKLNRIRVKDLLTELIFFYSKKWLKLYYDKKIEDLSYSPGRVSLELISKFLISRVDSEGLADKRGFNMNEEDCNKILLKEINFNSIDELPAPYKKSLYNKIFN